MRAPKFNSFLIIGITAILVLMSVSLWFSLSTTNLVKQNLHQQVTTRTIIIRLKQNLIDILTAESDGRAYALTGDKRYFDSFNNAVEQLNKDTLKLDSLALDQHQPMQHFQNFKDLIRQKLQFMNLLISLKDLHNEMIIIDTLKSGEGKLLMDRLRLSHSIVENRTVKLFQARQAKTAKSLRLANTAIVILCLLSVLIVLSLAIITFFEFNKRLKYQTSLVEQNEELARKNKEIEELSFISSHDLQEPLRTISNFSSLLSKRIHSASEVEIQEYLQYIQLGVSRMSGLITDVLEYSKINSSYEKVNIDCNELVKDIISSLNALIVEKLAIIKVDDLPEIAGYAPLRVVFQNLIINALKFSKKEEQPMITISSTTDEQFYTFIVGDNGIGFENRFSDKIFLMFQRLHNQTEYTGTGIGLALCKKIVELHGGKIWAHSETGKGSFFYFTISKFIE